MMLVLPSARHSEGESPSRLMVNSSSKSFPQAARRVRVFTLQPGGLLLELGDPFLRRQPESGAHCAGDLSLKVTCGRCSRTLRSLCFLHLCTATRSPKTRSIAARSALEPSITNNRRCLGSSPRATRSASNSVTTVAFSVAPSRTPSRCFLPFGSTP